METRLPQRKNYAGGACRPPSERLSRRASPLAARCRDPTRITAWDQVPDPDTDHAPDPDTDHAPAWVRVLAPNPDTDEVLALIRVLVPDPYTDEVLASVRVSTMDPGSDRVAVRGRHDRFAATVRDGGRNTNGNGHDGGNVPPARRYPVPRVR
jgi:hypothetical protein